jgi:hypothetical protein
MKIEERKKMILAMEFIARQINDENVFEGWLMCGVPDGDIKYGSFDTDQIYDEDYMLSDAGFKDLMSCFLRRMSGAYRSGGLYCDGVVSDWKEEEEEV